MANRLNRTTQVPENRLFPHKFTDCFAMHAHRELVHSPDPFQLIPVPAQYFQVSCQCRRIAADIYHLLRRHLHDRIQQHFIAAFARRIYHDHICPRRLAAVFPGIFFIISGQYFLRLSRKELCVLNSVYPSILPRVAEPKITRSCRSRSRDPTQSRFLSDPRIPRQVNKVFPSGPD